MSDCTTCKGNGAVGVCRGPGHPGDSATCPDCHGEGVLQSDLPKTTKEFALWLRMLAAEVERIPDRPLQMREEDVEVGFYYANPVFPSMPTGIYFEASATTKEPE